MHINAYCKNTTLQASQALCNIMQSLKTSVLVLVKGMPAERNCPVQSQEGDVSFKGLNSWMGKVTQLSNSCSSTAFLQWLLSQKSKKMEYVFVIFYREVCKHGWG